MILLTDTGNKEHAARGQVEVLVCFYLRPTGGRGTREGTCGSRRCRVDKRDREVDTWR